MNREATVDNLTEIPELLKFYPQTKAVLFDLGQTLVYGNFSVNQLRKKEREIFHVLSKADQAKLPFNKFFALKIREEKHFAQRSKSTTREYTFQRFSRATLKKFAKLTPAQLKKIEKISERHDIKFQKLEPGAKQTLQKLAKEGYKLGIISNSYYQKRHILNSLKAAGIKDFFKVIVVSSEFGFRKPNLKIYKEAISQLKVSKKETAFVGNTFDTDIIGSKDFDLLTIYYHSTGFLNKR